MFNLSEDPVVKDILLKCWRNTKITAKVLFPDRFSLSFSPLHNKIFEVLDDDSKQKVVIAAPRGFGKTSILMAYCAKNILFQDRRYIVPVSCSSTLAVLQSENLKNELLTNEVIIKLFGSVKSSEFSKEQWVTDSGIMVMPRGRGQQIRGLLYRNDRPDLILVDDLEDSESVYSEEQREKLKKWFFSDLMNSVHKGNKGWRVIVVGTVLHQDSLLENLLNDPNWYSLRLELFDDKFKSTWPEFMSDSDVEKMVEEYRNHNMLDSLYMEYRNVPISPDSAEFKAEYFRYYVDSDLKDIEEVVVLIDPAKTAKKTSDDSAIIAVGLSMSKNKIFVLDLDAGRFHPDELYEKAFEMCRRYRSRVLAYEVTSLHEFISYPLKTAAAQKGMVLEFIELQARGSKEERVRGLIPFYRRGEVFHNRANCGKLEAQLLSFPRSKKWDCMDVLAYIIPLLERGKRYYYASREEAGDDEYKDIEIDENIDDLEFDEDPIPDDDEVVDGWRII